MPSSIEAVRQLREAFMKTLYESAEGEQRRWVYPGAIAQRLTLDISAIPPILDYLRGEGFITNKPASEAIGLTHDGILEAERLIDDRTLKQASVAADVFAFVRDDQLRRVIEKDYAELKSLNPKANTKAVLVMAGAVIEGVLLDALASSGKWSFDAACQQNLSDMVGPAQAKGIIKEQRLSEAARKYRALIHPGRAVREGLIFDEADAQVAAATTDIIIREVRSWYSRQSPSPASEAARIIAPTPTSAVTAGRPYLPACEQALEVQLTSGHRQNFAVSVKSHADEQFAVSGVSVECEGTQLGQILRPTDIKLWTLAPQGQASMQWPPNQVSIPTEVMKLRSEYRNEFMTPIDFVFQCMFEDGLRTFRKRMQVQVDPLNHSMRQF